MVRYTNTGIEIRALVKKGYISVTKALHNNGSFRVSGEEVFLFILLLNTRVGDEPGSSGVSINH